MIGVECTEDTLDSVLEDMGGPRARFVTLPNLVSYAERTPGVAEALSLQGLLKKSASGLTADQKQLISLGRGLVRDDVAAVLMDEPLTVIDPDLKFRLRRQLKEINQKYRSTLIYVTHDQNEAMTFAENIIVMDATSWPAVVSGNTSPYLTVVIVTDAQ